MIKVENVGLYYLINEISGSKKEIIRTLSYFNKSYYIERINNKYRIKKEHLILLKNIDNNVVLIKRPWDDIGSTMLLEPFSYQKETIFHSINNINSLLILPTGAGKTPIMIGIYMEALKRNITDKPAIIVVKASLKYQWLNEVKKFSNLKAEVIETPSKKKKKFDNQFIDKDIFILNYETLENEKVYKKLIESGADTILCDEIQYISNHKTNRSKATYKFNNLKIRIGATATPITNNPVNLFGLFNFINKDVFTNYSSFSKNFIVWRSFGQVKGVRNKDLLIKKISKYMFVKDGEEIEQQLPSLIVNKLYCEMTPELYEINELIMSDLEKERKNNEQLENKIPKNELSSNEEYISSKAKIMAYQTFAQELADDPRLLTESDSNMSKKYHTNCKSPKLYLLFNTIEEILDTDNKVCIFTNYERMQRILKEEIEKKFKVKCAIVNGSMNSKERFRQAYDLFGDDEEYKVLIATSAMEEGISLSKCKYLIEYDLASSYASQIQRHGRVKRANSVSRVSYVYQLICKDSWDEIQEKIILKKEKYDKELIRSI